MDLTWVYSFAHPNSCSHTGVLTPLIFPHNPSFSHPFDGDLPFLFAFGLKLLFGLGNPTTLLTLLTLETSLIFSGRAIDEFPARLRYYLADLMAILPPLI